MSHWRQQVESFIRGRRWIVAHDVAQATAKGMQRVMDLGAQDVLGIATSMGTGDLAPHDPDKLVVLDVQGEGLMGGIRASEEAYQSLPARLLERIEAFDPRREAGVLRPPFAVNPSVAGRRVFGIRPPEWQALEDKVVIDAVWDEAGIPRAPYRVVPVAEAVSVNAELDAGDGTVWAGDATQGFNGGASYTRLIRSERDAAEAAAWFAEGCDRVRVMPFLDGLPCSIHGLVAPGDEHLVAVQPMEMLVLRGPSGFVYCGGAPNWRPRAPVHDAMRATARRMAAHLRDTLGYRGAFTIDGVATRDGFRPTELNPRFGAALSPCNTDAMPLTHLVEAMVEGLALDYRMAELEPYLLSQLGQPRSHYCGVPLTVKVDQQRTLEVDEARLILGPSTSGSYLRIILPDTTPVGPAVAPRIVRLLRHAAQAWDLPLDDLEAAPVY